MNLFAFEFAAIKGDGKAMTTGAFDVNSRFDDQIESRGDGFRLSALRADYLALTVLIEMCLDFRHTKPNEKFEELVTF